MGADIPAGFHPFPLGTGFVNHVGPVYWHRDGNEVRLGFRVAEEHANPAGICHGGMLMTIVDIQIGIGCGTLAGLDAFLPTINLNCDFLDVSHIGEWVEGRAELVRQTRRMIFGTAMMTADGRPVMRANALMKIAGAGDSRFAWAGRSHSFTDAAG